MSVINEFRENTGGKAGGRISQPGLWLRSKSAKVAAAILSVLFVLTVFPGSRSELKSVERPDPEIYLYCDGSFPTSQKTVNFSISGRYIRKIKYKLVRIDTREVMAASSNARTNPDELKKMEFKSAEVVKEWGFSFASKRSADWRSTYGNFSNPGPGFYILYASEGKTVALSGFLITDIAVISKRDGKKAVFMVVDRFKGTPIKGAKVTAYKDGKVAFEAESDSSGLVVYENPDAGTDSIPVLASYEKNDTIHDVNYWWYSQAAGYKFYTVTDRPVYRPGHKVEFKTTVRKADGSAYTAPDVKNIDVEIKDPKGNSLYKETLTLNEYGSCSGSLIIADEPPIGTYSIVSTANGQTGYQNFTVEEYRKPEYEVKVKADKDVTLQGNKIKYRIEAKYYFGEPVKDTDVTYTVTRTNRWQWHYWGRYSWYYDDESYYYNYGGETVTSGTGKTDEKGILEVTIPTTKLTTDSDYKLVANVTDKSRRQVSGSGSALAVRSEFNITLRTDKYMYKPADKVRITATAADHSGHKVKGSKISFVINKIEWDYKKNYERKDTKVLTKTVETDKDGEAVLDFTPDMQGYFEVHASTKDSKENDVTGDTTFYVTSPSDTNVYWISGGVKIVMDKDSYKPGDTARALITTNMPGATALVSVEADSIFTYAALDMPQGSALFEFKVTEKMEPNAFVSVALIQANNFTTTQQLVVVPPVEKFLNVTIKPDKGEYRPGDKAKISVNVTDADGKPVKNVEVSLGVVDESIYALQPENVPDAREFFYGKRWDSVQTACSLWFNGGRYAREADKAMTLTSVAETTPMDAAKAPAPGGRGKKDGSDEEGAYAEAKIRTDFRDTAWWGAHLVTDADGKAQATFTMPDSLTTWRATARAISPETKVGNITEKTIVRKNLLVRLETPRFFTQGDVQNITAVVHNYLSTAKNVRCQLNAKGLKLADAGDKVVKIPAGGDVRVEWHATVEAPQTAWVTVKALTDEESDAMQLDIPVLPHGIKKWSAIAGEVEDGTTKKNIDVPADAIKGATTLRVSLSPSIAASMFESLDYLVGYPYGCVEQTMSRFLPDIVVEQAMQRLKLPNTEAMKDLPKMVDQGLQRLANFQHGDDGWGWWEHDETHPFMTAYVIYGLTQAMKADYKVDKSMYDRGVAALEKLSEKEKDFNTSSYMLFALDAAGEKNAKLLDGLYSKYKKLNPYAQALVAIVLENNGRHDDALSVIRELEKSAKASATSARWEGQSFHYSWMDNTVETTAFVLKALLRVDPDNALIQKTVRHLVLSRNGDHWYSTKDTAAAVLALTDFVTQKEDLKPNLDVVVKLNGKELATKHFSAGDVFKPAVVVEVPDTGGVLKTGKNALEITKKSGSGKVYYTATLNYFDAQKDIKANNTGIAVSRFYSFDAAGKRKLKRNSVIKPGTEIYVHISVNPTAGYEYAIIEDMLPSGFEVVKEEYDYPYYYGGWSWWYPHKEIRDEKVAFFATNMYDRIYDLSYRIRAEVPGSVSALPARAWLMYFPEIGGNSGEFSFKVTE